MGDGAGQGQWLRGTGGCGTPQSGCGRGVGTDPCQELAMGRRSRGGEGYGKKGLGLAREASEPVGRGLVG